MTRLHRHPFTLLEVIIVVSLLTSVLLVLFLGLYGVMQSWDRQVVHARHFESTLVLDRTLDTILSNTIPFTWPDDTYPDQPIFSGARDQVTLAYLHRVHRMEDGAIRFCHLRQEDAELVAYYCERPPFPLELYDERLTRTVLASGVEWVDFSYADYEEEQIYFTEDWGERLQLPLAIQVRVRWEDGREQQWLRRTAGSSFYERLGAWERGERP